MAYARFPPPEPTTCNEIDPATQFGFSNDPDPITRIQILGRRNLSTVGRNCKQAKKEIMFSTQKKMLEGIAGEKKVQGIYVLRTKKSVLGGIAGAKKGNCVPCPETVYLQKLPLHKTHSY